MGLNLRRPRDISTPALASAVPSQQSVPSPRSGADVEVRVACSYWVRRRRTQAERSGG